MRALESEYLRSCFVHGKKNLPAACLPQRPFCVRSRNLTGSANILFYIPCHLPTLLHLLLKALQRLICFSWIVTDCCQNILAKFFQANAMFNYRGSQFITVSVCSSPSSNTFEWSWVVSTILEWTYKSYIRDAFYVRWNLFISQFTQMAISFK